MPTPDNYTSVDELMGLCHEQDWQVTADHLDDGGRLTIINVHTGEVDETLQKPLLAYVRNSYIRGDEEEKPTRQLYNILKLARSRGFWRIHLFFDVGGHKSGAKIDGRPGYMAFMIELRQHASNYGAVAADDIDRFNRAMAASSDLFNLVTEKGLPLYEARFNTEIDLSNHNERLVVDIRAVFGEHYVRTISSLVKDKLSQKKAKGHPVGFPPAGTMIKDNRLVPRRDGVFLMPDGSVIAGEEGYPPDVEGAVFRGYYGTVKRVLNMLAQDFGSTRRIAKQLRDEGWPFRMKDGTHRQITRDDVRRIKHCIYRYGGAPTSGRARDEDNYRFVGINEIPWDEGRALFDIDLLKQALKTVRKRSGKRVDSGDRKVSYPYAFSMLIRCEGCEESVRKYNDVTYRTTFVGAHTKRGYFYRSNRKCECNNKWRSVPMHIPEEQFRNLLKLLSLDEEAFQSMLAIAQQLEQTVEHTESVDTLQQRTEAVARCKRRIQAARALFLDGDDSMDLETYQQIRQENEQEIAYWQAQGQPEQERVVKLEECLHLLNNLDEAWDIADPAERQQLVRQVTEYITFDTNTQLMTDFRLKSWADDFLVVRAAQLQQDSPLKKAQNPVSDDETGSTLGVHVCPVRGAAAND